MESNHKALLEAKAGLSDSELGDWCNLPTCSRSCSQSGLWKDKVAGSLPTPGGTQAVVVQDLISS